MVKEDFSDIESIPDSGYIIDDTPNSAVVKDLYRRALGASDALSDLLKRKLDTGGGPINTGFVVAKTPNGEPVACGGYSHASTISYFHCLGTLKEHRRRGIAKHMAKVRLRMMRERGVEYTVGAVSKRNIPSIEMQKSLGYRVLEETVIWRKIE
jgi:ribosomal protein S18 acetylase RimI-like enzyme